MGACRERWYALWKVNIRQRNNAQMAIADTAG